MPNLVIWLAERTLVSSNNQMLPRLPRSFEQSPTFLMCGTVWLMCLVTVVNRFFYRIPVLYRYFMVTCTNPTTENRPTIAPLRGGGLIANHWKPDCQVESSNRTPLTNYSNFTWDKKKFMFMKSMSTPYISTYISIHTCHIKHLQLMNHDTFYSDFPVGI